MYVGISYGHVHKLLLFFSRSHDFRKTEAQCRRLTGPWNSCQTSTMRCCTMVVRKRTCSSSLSSSGQTCDFKSSTVGQQGARSARTKRPSNPITQRQLAFLASATVFVAFRQQTSSTPISALSMWFHAYVCVTSHHPTVLYVSKIKPALRNMRKDAIKAARNAASEVSEIAQPTAHMFHLPAPQWPTAPLPSSKPIHMHHCSSDLFCFPH